MMGKTKEQTMYEHGIQQFIGFGLGSQGCRIEELVSSMGLTELEWKRMKNDGEVNQLSEQDVEDVDKYFKEETK